MYSCVWPVGTSKWSVSTTSGSECVGKLWCPSTNTLTEPDLVEATEKTHSLISSILSTDLSRLDFFLRCLHVPGLSKFPPVPRHGPSVPLFVLGSTSGLDRTVVDVTRVL